MKKTILITIATFISAVSFAQKDSSKAFKIELDGSTWDIYFRNIDRLNLMAGRNIQNSEIVLTTKDTIQMLQQIFIAQLNTQLPKKEQPKN
jgi:hypothetical protein